MTALVATRPPAERERTHTGRRVAYRGRRVLLSVLRLLSIFVPVFLLGTFLTFLLGHLSGLSPAHLQLGESATPQAVAALEHEWGLDRPFLVQYLDWFSGILHGDFGDSWANGNSVAELLGPRAVVSLSAAGLALAIGVLGGVLLGTLAALYPTSWIDRSVTVFTSAISVLPPFVVGITLVAVFAVSLKWLPSAGFVPIEAGAWPWLSHLILPALALSVDTVADVARQLRVGLISAYRDNYVTGAVVRGLSARRIFFVHVLRNGVGPAVAILGLKFPNLLGGAVVTEAIFGLAGYGVFASESALRGDVPAVQAVLVVAVFLVVIFNLAVNIILNRIIPASARGV